MVDVLINMEPITSNPKVPITFVEVHENGVISAQEEDDLVTEQEDCENEQEEGHSKSDHRWLSPPPRTKTRLLSRSHSVSDLGSEDGLKPEIESFRRNSSGEYNQQQQQVPLAPLSPMNGRKMSSSDLAQTMTITLNNKLLDNVDGKSPPVTPNTHLSPINFQQHQVHQTWKPPKASPTQENDTFTLLLQTTAERVLNKLKSRQQDLGKNLQMGRKIRKQQHGVHQTVPRKLQPIHRDGTKTPLTRPESNLSDQKGDSDTASIFSSA